MNDASFTLSHTHIKTVTPPLARWCCSPVSSEKPSSFLQGNAGDEIRSIQQSLRCPLPVLMWRLFALARYLLSVHTHSLRDKLNTVCKIFVCVSLAASSGNLLIVKGEGLRNNTADLWLGYCISGFRFACCIMSRLFWPVHPDELWRYRSLTCRYVGPNYSTTS